MQIPAKFVVISGLLLLCTAAAAEPTLLFREDFTSLDRWKAVSFPKIRRQTAYTIEQRGGKSILRAESDASASALAYQYPFDITAFPVIHWRWKVDSVYQQADPATKAGDDYPLRIYVTFDYDPAKAGFAERAKYGLARRLYGEYPPHSSLNYVWAGTDVPATPFASPYTDRVKIIALRSGASQTGVWLEERVNVLDDYRKAFGTDPPGRARLIVMNDSDNTGGHSVSWMDYIEVLSTGAAP